MLSDLVIRLKCLGQFGKPIYVCKFRTMCSDAEGKYQETLSKSELDALGKILNDSRITPFGKFLREHWIDELPQIYNLIIGDISLVGLRPKNAEFWEENYSQEFRERALKYKPGLFGVPYSQKVDSFEETKQIEEEYISQVEQRGKTIVDKEYFFAIIKSKFFGEVRSK